MTTKEKALGAGEPEALTKVNAAIVAPQDFTDKKFATLAAELALRGFALYRLDCGGFLIARWDRTSYSPDLRGVSQFLERIS